MRRWVWGALWRRRAPHRAWPLSGRGRRGWHLPVVPPAAEADPSLVLGTLSGRRHVMWPAGHGGGQPRHVPLLLMAAAQPSWAVRRSLLQLVQAAGVMVLAEAQARLPLRALGPGGFDSSKGRRVPVPRSGRG